MVRASAGKRALRYGGITLVAVGLVACLVGAVMAFSPEPESGGEVVRAMVTAAGVPLLLLSVGMGLQTWLIVSGGPVLALSPAGVWIRTRASRGQAIWLPWEGIEHISRRRWSVEKFLVVKPRDPRTVQDLGAFTTAEMGPLLGYLGSPLIATLNTADKSEAEILAAVAHFSAGRVPVTW